MLDIFLEKIFSRIITVKQNHYQTNIISSFVDSSFFLLKIMDLAVAIGSN